MSRSRWPFWLVAYVFLITMVGVALPTPLYVIYQRRWGFSAGMITLIFAAYAAGVLAALLTAGRSSDQVGRRPVLFAALGFSALSTLAFIFAGGVPWLFAGRALSGVSAGLVTGTGTAALTEAAGSGSGRRASTVATVATIAGVGLGPLVAGIFSQFLPHPTVLVFEFYLGALAVGALATWMVPETVARRSRLQFRFAGLALPRDATAEFIGAGASGFVALSMLGLFTALAPSFLQVSLHLRNHAVGGAVVFLIFAVATATQVALARSDSRRVIQAGLIGFAPALAVIVLSLALASFPLFLAGTAVAGLPAGALFIGSLATANRLAPAEMRGRIVSTFFVFAYLGLIVPAIGVGLASEHVGQYRAVLGCAVVLTAVCLAALAATRRRPAVATAA